MIITVGSGGVRPNMNALSGIQYKLPDQAEQLNFFFSIQYFMMKFGSMTACFVVCFFGKQKETPEYNSVFRSRDELYMFYGNTNKVKTFLRRQFYTPM